MSNVYKLHSAKVYLNTEPMPQMASEVTLPAVKHKMATHAPTALKFAFEIPIGVEPMELKIKGDFDPAFVSAAVNSAMTHRLQIYSDLAEYDDDTGTLRETQVAAYMTVFFKDVTPGALKNSEASEIELSASVLAYKLEVAGVPQFDLRPLSNKHEVMGVNINARNDEILGGGA